MNAKRLILFVFISLSFGINSQNLKTEILSPVCIESIFDYHYKTCASIFFTINERQFYIPVGFETDFSNMPSLALNVAGAFHATTIAPIIIHDWFYRKTCDFTRLQTDLIFYYMLKNQGLSGFRASIAYKTVRLFGADTYTEDYCDDEYKGLDKETRGIQVASLFGLTA